MNPAAAAGLLSDQQTKYLLIAGGIVLVGGIWYAHWQAGRARDTVGDLLTGDGPLTKGTPYSGTGILGTIGSATNKILGGVPEKLGSEISYGLYELGELFNDDPLM